jgi:polygalacturonase
MELILTPVATFTSPIVTSTSGMTALRSSLGRKMTAAGSWRPCENIVITNSTLLDGHGGVVFGSEMSGSIRNVTISNCVMTGTDRGLRFQARRGRGGIVENARATNIVMDGVLCPIAVNLFYGCGAWDDEKVTNQSPLPVAEGRTLGSRYFRAIWCHSAGRPI